MPLIISLFSMSVFRDNVVLINRHNLEVDEGLHSYTMKINQFADMVRTLTSIDSL